MQLPLRIQPKGTETPPFQHQMSVRDVLRYLFPPEHPLLPRPLHTLNRPDALILSGEVWQVVYSENERSNLTVNKALAASHLPPQGSVLTTQTIRFPDTNLTPKTPATPDSSPSSANILTPVTIMTPSSSLTHTPIMTPDSVSSPASLIVDGENVENELIFVIMTAEDFTE